MLSQIGIILGGVLVGAAAVQSVLLLLNTLSRSAFQKKQQALALETWQHRVDAAKASVTREESQAQHSWNGYRKFEVKRKEFEDDTKGICSFYLWPHDERPLPEFHPGQYITFELKIPGQPGILKRCYSLSDSPDPDYFRVSIKRVPDGRSSGFFHEQVREGDFLNIRAPSGKFHVDMMDDYPIVLLGSGVGITPCLSIINALAAKRSRRECWLFYGAREEGELVQRKHLESLAQEHENLHVHFAFSGKKPEECTAANDHAGRISTQLLAEVLPSNNYDYYMCGPGAMMSSMKEQLLAWGVPDDNIHYEAFGPASVQKKAAPAIAAGAPAMKVTFAKSGQSFDWDPNAGTLLDFAESKGLNLECGCRAGNCGSCEIAIKDGKVDYVKDPEYSDLGEGNCLTCVSVPKGDITLDA
jgi:uncharacterized protein